MICDLWRRHTQGNAQHETQDEIQTTEQVNKTVWPVALNNHGERVKTESPRTDGFQATPLWFCRKHSQSGLAPTALDFLRKVCFAMLILLLLLLRRRRRRRWPTPNKLCVAHRVRAHRNPHPTTPGGRCSTQHPHHDGRHQHPSIANPLATPVLSPQGRLWRVGTNTHTHQHSPHSSLSPSSSVARPELLLLPLPPVSGWSPLCHFQPAPGLHSAATSSCALYTPSPPDPFPPPGAGFAAVAFHRFRS